MAPLAKNLSVLSKLERYLDLVLKENQKFNLIGACTERECLIKHILDSASANRYFKKYSSVMDIGTGAGFPGMVLAILNSELEQRYYLVESKEKKTRFLNEVIKEIDLKKVHVIQANIKECKIKSQAVTCRAFSNFKKVFSLIKNQSLTHSDFLFYKATLKKIAEEKKAISRLPDAIIPLSVPFLKAERHLVIFNQDASSY